jgi:parvulin-like peptidyl-prolyl isomerase
MRMSFLRMWAVCAMVIALSGCFFFKKEEKRRQEAIQALKKMESEEKTLKEKASSVEAVHVSKGELAEGVVARVNDEVILLSDVERSLDEILQATRRSRSSLSPREMRQARKVALKRLIARKLLEQEAQRRNYQVTEKEVDEAFERYLKRRGITKEQLYVELAAKKETVSQFKERIRRELLVFKLTQGDIRRHLHVTEEECRRYYDEHKEDYGKPGRVRIQQIVLITKGDDPGEIQRKRQFLEEIRKRLLNGEDFGEMARRYSQGPLARKGGDLGFFKRGELLPELDEAAFSLTQGQVSQVIQTSVGLHLLRVMEKEPDQLIPFEEVKEKIRRRLIEEQFQKELQQLINSLMKTAFIQISEELR